MVPRAVGSAWKATNTVLNAFAIRAPGRIAAYRSAPDVPPSVARPEKSAFAGFEASMTTLPAACPPSSAATQSNAWKGTARRITSASLAASAALAAADAPISDATCLVFAASRAANVTSCPARTSELPIALPTFPVPMIAIFMTGSPLPCCRRLDCFLSANNNGNEKTIACY